MGEGLSKISINFALHLIKVGKLKRFKKISSDLKTILITDLADLQFCSFLGFEKGETCRSMLQSSQVKRTPKMSLNEFIIQKLNPVNPLVVVDFRFISALLHA